MRFHIYTLWASMKGEEPSPWMIAAEDEFSWEADGDRCDNVFANARKLADENGWDVRELNLIVELDKVIGAFEPDEVEATVGDGE